MSRIDDLNRVLRDLRNEGAEITACALISEDSLMIAGALPREIEEGRVAGMCATMYHLGARASSELKLRTLRQVLVRCDGGYAVMATATAGTMLIVLTTEGAKLGLVFLDMGRAVEEIERILEPTTRSGAR